MTAKANWGDRRARVTRVSVNRLSGRRTSLLSPIGLSAGCDRVKGGGQAALEALRAASADLRCLWDLRHDLKAGLPCELSASQKVRVLAIGKPSSTGCLKGISRLTAFGRAGRPCHQRNRDFVVSLWLFLCPTALQDYAETRGNTHGHNEVAISVLLAVTDVLSIC